MLVLGGCSAAPLALFDSVTNGLGSKVKDKTLDAAANSVKRYCDNVPQATRIELRNDINARIDNGAIAITCDGDI